MTFATWLVVHSDGQSIATAVAEIVKENDAFVGADGRINLLSPSQRGVRATSVFPLRRWLPSSIGLASTWADDVGNP